MTRRISRMEIRRRREARKALAINILIGIPSVFLAIGIFSIFAFKINSPFF